MGAFRENVNSYGFGKAILFILSPFLSFLFSLRDLSSKSSYAVLICICLLFGLNFNVSNNRSLEHNLDGSYYREIFERDYVDSDVTVKDVFSNYFSFSSEKNTDLYVDLISLFVSKFSSNYHILFLVYALVFTFFMVGSLKYLLQLDNFKNNSIVCLLLVLLFLQNDIFNINGVRFWTAAWVAVYSFFKIYVDDKKLYLLLTAITPFIHASFLLLVFVVLLSLIFRNAASNLKYLLFFSIILSPLMLFVMQSIDTSRFPPLISRYFDLYASDAAISEYGAKRVSTLYYTITTIFRAASLVYINILALKVSRGVNGNKSLGALSNFLIILIIFCNLTTILPSIGVRFIVLACPIISYMWLSSFGIKKESMWIKVFPLFFFFILRSKVLYYLMVLDGDFFYMNLFHLILKNI